MKLRIAGVLLFVVLILVLTTASEIYDFYERNDDLIEFLEP